MRPNVVVTIEDATEEDVPAIAAIHAAVAEDLTRRYGEGHWSRAASDTGVQRTLYSARLVVARDAGEVAGTLTLAAKKPWAIDVTYFTPVTRPLYLTGMAVAPWRQRAGIGRRMVAAAMEIARAWPADAIRLDAYDAPAGAGAFYAKCGFTERGRAIYRGTGLIYFEVMVEGA
jgi:ribosomal protein S18 acetylase RimI-like enzyme